MNSRYLIIGLFMLLFCGVRGQACLHTDLSKRFDYKIIKSGKKDTDGFVRKPKITIEIYNKSDKSLFQRLQFTAEGDLYNTFDTCANDRSYITGKNKDVEVSDEDYGDIVVADLNFDGKEDFAVKYHMPVDVGPEYWYFIQGKHGFKKDDYLSDKMPFFPWLIKRKTHTLISIVSPNWGTNIYQFKYNVSTKKWRKIGYRFIYHDIGLEKVLARLKK